MMPTTARTNERRKRGGAARLAMLAGALAAMLAAQAPAKSPWENIATMIRNKAADAASTASLDSTTATQPRLAEAPPAVAGVPDEVSATSGSQARTLGSAALALLNLTAGSADKTGKLTPGGAAKAEKAIELGRESDESEAMLAANLFKNKDILRLLGDKPRFIYDPANRPDPMIVPWVRRAAIFKELAALAEEYAAGGDLDKAVAVYQRILRMNDPRFNAEIQEKLQAIADKQNALAVALVNQAKAVVEETVELPAWIQENTNGVIVSPGNEICLVGEFMLHPGDSVPSYPEVEVARITSTMVVYQIKNRSFEVKLNRN